MPANPQTSTNVLSLNLRFHRDQLGKTQTEMAEKCRISSRLYQDLEAGKANPTLATLCNLAQAFRISTDRLLRLDRVRIQPEQAIFITHYKKHLKNLDCAAGLRTLDGILLWANPYMENLMGGMDLHSKPVNLMTIYPPAGRENLRAQLASERQGLLATYTNHVVAKTGEPITLRGYPTLIYPSVGKEPILTSLYVSEIHRDCHEHYFQYCENFLECLRH